MNFILAYITTKDKEQALSVGKILVEEHLAACVNIFDNMTSVYRWDEKICSDNEAVLIAKTAAEKFEQLCKRVKELHTYDCPCVVSIPITDGNSQYLEWLAANLG
jgi:periplasmic divalent cation tolerance protein